MKKLMSLVLAGVAVFSLSACGSDEEVIDTFTSVDIKDLKDGLIIDGHNVAGQHVEFKFCKGDYKYIAGDDSFIGTYLTAGDIVEFIESNLDVYTIVADNEELEVGEEYEIIGEGNEIIVDEIREDPSC